MIDLNNIKLSDEDIWAIEHADYQYRNIDLESFAKNNEDGLINNKTCLFSTILASTDFDSFNDIKRVSINKTVREDRTNNRLFSINDLKYPPKRVVEKLYYNRASYKKQSMFYGGFGDFQGHFENPPNTGDLFTISTWRQKVNTKLHFAIIFHDEKLQECTDMDSTTSPQDSLCTGMTERVSSEFRTVEANMSKSFFCSRRDCFSR